MIRFGIIGFRLIYLEIKKKKKIIVSKIGVDWNGEGMRSLFCTFGENVTGNKRRDRMIAVSSQKKKYPITVLFKNKQAETPLTLKMGNLLRG